MIGVEANLDDVLSSLSDSQERYKEAIAKGFAQAGRQIVDLFRRDWLSGRVSGLGLNIRTGNLFQSIQSNTSIRGNTINSEVFNRGATYWDYHQNPQDGRPKYLYLNEAFQEDGAPIYVSQVEQAMRQVS